METIALIRRINRAGDTARADSPEICMFSSDYPHAEGGRNPYGRFKSATKGLPESTLDCFYRRNFEDLMGSVLA